MVRYHVGDRFRLSSQPRLPLGPSLEAGSKDRAEDEDRPLFCIQLVCGTHSVVTGSHYIQYLRYWYDRALGEVISKEDILLQVCPLRGLRPISGTDTLCDRYVASGPVGMMIDIYR